MMKLASPLSSARPLSPPRFSGARFIEHPGILYDTIVDYKNERGKRHYIALTDEDGIHWREALHKFMEALLERKPIHKKISWPWRHPDQQAQIEAQQAQLADQQAQAKILEAAEALDRLKREMALKALLSSNATTVFKTPTLSSQLELTSYDAFFSERRDDELLQYPRRMRPDKGIVPAVPKNLVEESIRLLESTRLHDFYLGH